MSSARQGVRLRRAARPLHRHRRRDRRSAESQGDVAHQRRAAPVEQHVEHDLDLRRAHSLLFAQLHAQPGMVIITGTPAGTAWSADKELGGKGVTQPGLVPATRYCLPGDIVDARWRKSACCAIRLRGPTKLPAGGADRQTELRPGGSTARGSTIREQLHGSAEFVTGALARR